LEVSYSLWPARKKTRWTLQRRLYVKDPWAILFEAVYRSSLAKPKIYEALSYLNQAEDYFNAGSQGWRMNVKPVLLYYSMLNLAKALLVVRNPALDMALARHGLSAQPRKTAILGDRIAVKTSAKNVNVFGELLRVLEGGSGPSFQGLQVRHLLPQVLPAHRLWTYACGKTEKFVALGDIQCCINPSDRLAWLVLTLNSGEAKHLRKSVSQLLAGAHLPGLWYQVQDDTRGRLTLEQGQPVRYLHRPIDCIQVLFQQLRPALWSAVTPSYPHRKYYLFIDQGLGRKRLPQWAAMYALFFYLSDLTRYRPQHFERFLESRYGPQIESILDECPRQFLFLMASELLQREVAPADLA
jgi:hypothetical protein